MKKIFNKKFFLRFIFIFFIILISGVLMWRYINNYLRKPKATNTCRVDAYGGCTGTCNNGGTCTPLLNARGCYCSVISQPTNPPTPIRTSTQTPTPIRTSTQTPTPISTPILTQQTTPINVPNCICESSGLCASVCPVNQRNNYWGGASSNNINYSNPMKCSLSNNIFYTSLPNLDQKNNNCNRALRPKGDANGDGVINFLGDYLNYIQVVSGGKISSDINPDVNGDGVVSADDGIIIRENMQK